MRRREFIAGLGSAAALPVVARAQQPGRMRRIAVLDNPGSDSEPLTAFQQDLQKAGWRAAMFASITAPLPVSRTSAPRRLSWLLRRRT